MYTGPKENICYYDMPIGTIGIAADDGGITGIFLNREPGISGQETPLHRQAYEQLSQYFAGSRQEFDLPLAPCGTEFRHRVWDALCQIPYGKTASYGQIAQMIGQPKAARAVGGANHHNPILIVVP